MHTVDIIYLAHGRREFTGTSLLNLLRNTNWKRVEGLYIYTDGEDFSPLVKDIPALKDISAITRKVGGPVAILNAAVRMSDADYIVKIDNDTMVPPMWLEYCLETLQQRNVDLLGLEAWADDMTVFPDVPFRRPAVVGHADPPSYAIRTVRHIGGIGFYRRSAFYSTTSFPDADGRQGLTQWQWANPSLKCAFLDPVLPVFLLDHLPFEPWLTLSKRYEEQGVQRRQWGMYPDSCRKLWEWAMLESVKVKTV